MVFIVPSGSSSVLHTKLWTARCWALDVAHWKGTERRSLRQVEVVRVEVASRWFAVLGRRIAWMTEGSGVFWGHGRGG
jgi:hypothetical protein